MRKNTEKRLKELEEKVDKLEKERVVFIPYPNPHYHYPYYPTYPTPYYPYWWYYQGQGTTTGVNPGITWTTLTSGSSGDFDGTTSTFDIAANTSTSYEAA